MDAVVIGHEDEWNFRLCSESADHREDAAQRCSAAECTFRRLLDDRTVGNRVGKWDAQFDNIRARLLQFNDELLRFRQAGIAGHQIDNERFLSLSSQSLERFVQAVVACCVGGAGRGYTGSAR